MLEQPLAAGRTADVYTWDEGRVVKWFHPWMPVEAIRLEQRNATIAREFGLPVPAVGDLIERDGKVGLIFERVNGSSMLSMLDGDRLGSIEQSARQLAELHAGLHAHQAPESLPDQAEVLRERIERCAHLAPTERAAALGALAGMPAGASLCHGDFHPGNVMLAQQGPVIIDWIDARRGNPIADVARTSVLFGGHIQGVASAEVRTAMELYRETYLNHYMAQTAGNWDEYCRWLPIVAAARLTEGIAEQQDWLRVQVQEGLGLNRDAG